LILFCRITNYQYTD